MKKNLPLQSSYELGNSLFGKYESKKKNLSTIYKKLIKAKLNLKYAIK